jgi:hypothetical protein
MAVSAVRRFFLLTVIVLLSFWPRIGVRGKLQRESSGGEKGMLDSWVKPENDRKKRKRHSRKSGNPALPFSLKAGVLRERGRSPTLYPHPSKQLKYNHDDKFPYNPN